MNKNSEGKEKSFGHRGEYRKTTKPTQHITRGTSVIELNNKMRYKYWIYLRLRQLASCFSILGIYSEILSSNLISGPDLSSLPHIIPHPHTTLSAEKDRRLKKMNALDSPLEALALNYLSYGFLAAVNSIWAWVAVITAAVSFWSIRALSSQPVLRAEQRSRSQDAASRSSASPKVAEMAVAEPATVSTTPLSSAPTTSMMSCGNVLESEGGTKTKFSLFYKEDDFREDNEDGEMENKGGEMEDDGGRDVVVREKLGGRCDDWERMMVLRMGDLGWYRWQDRTVVDGSVVRLWDSCRRRHAAPLMVDSGGAW